MKAPRLIGGGTTSRLAARTRPSKTRVGCVSLESSDVMVTFCMLQVMQASGVGDVGDAASRNTPPSVATVRC